MNFLKGTLEKLRVADAGYRGVPKEQCLPTTRVDIRKSIMSHLNDPSNRFVWLRGPPGTGKTAIAKSVAEDLDVEGRLAASFFFDKSGGTEHTNNLMLFVSTLARQLADFYVSYRRALFKIVKSRTWSLPRSWNQQLEELILRPLAELPLDTTSTGRSHVIVIDGLDECGDQRALEHLMTLIVALQRLPLSFQVLASSRPEPEVADAWALHYPNIPTDDTERIDPDSTFEDIVTNIRSTLAQLPPRGSTSWPPPEDEIRLCARQCGGIFEIMKIRMRIMERTTAIPMDYAFQELIKDRQRGVPTYTAEYLRILRKGYFTPFVPTNEDEEGAKLQIARGTVLDRFRKTFACMLLMLGGWPTVGRLLIWLPISLEEMASALRPISSMIHFPHDVEDPIIFFHATCREFFLGHPRGDEEDKVFFLKHDVDLVPTIYLEFMIARLRPSGLLKFIPSDWQESGWEPRFGLGDRYFDLHMWVYILFSPQNKPSKLVMSLVRIFLSQHLLAWVEAVVWIEYCSSLSEHFHGSCRDLLQESLSSLERSVTVSTIHITSVVSGDIIASLSFIELTASRLLDD